MIVLTTIEYYYEKRETEISKNIYQELSPNKNQIELIGKKISWKQFYELQPGPVVGVVRDFHQETLRNKVDPTVFVYEPIWLRTFLVKLETSELQSTLSSIDEIWKEMFPEYPMESAFLDDMFDKLYESEQKQKEILSLFSSLIIVIALLGLLGLLSFMIQKRMKELAIRKILGASPSSIIFLFGRGFIIQAFWHFVLPLRLLFILCTDGWIISPTEHQFQDLNFSCPF